MKFSKAIEGYKLSCLTEGYSPNTMEGYDWALKKIETFLFDPNIEEITPEDIKRVFFHLNIETNLSSSSIQSIWRSMRSFFNWATRELGIKRPDNYIPMPVSETKTVIPYSASDLKSLIQGCDYTNKSNSTRRKSFRMLRKTRYRDKAIILLLLDTGLRVSECTRLRISDINLETGETIVRPFRKGRKSKSRVVFLGVNSRKALWRYLVDRDTEGDDPLFLSIKGKPMNRDSVRQMLVKLGKRVGIRNVHPHRFRHTFAIQFLRNGGNVFELQRLLGHSSLEMVKNYLALAQVDLEQAHRRASPVDNWRL